MNSGRDFHSLPVPFKISKHRFEQWKQAVGIKDGKLSDTHHPALDDAKTLSIVYELLESIKEYCGGAEDALEQQHVRAGGEFPTNKPFSAHQARPRHGMPTDSNWRKVVWALGGKTKRTDQVQLFAILVQYLIDLVPPHDDAKSMRPGHKRLDYGPVHLQGLDNTLELLVILS